MSEYTKKSLITGRTPEEVLILENSIKDLSPDIIRSNKRKEKESSKKHAFVPVYNVKRHRKKYGKNNNSKIDYKPITDTIYWLDSNLCGDK